MKLSTPNSDTCIAFLLRHGATDNNLAQPPVLQGNSVDGSLSAEGRRQAASAAELLRRYPLSAIYSSPLQRAHQTAEFVAAHQACHVEIEPRIHEVDVGQWEGRSWVHIAEQEPDAYERFMKDPGRYGYVGGECLGDVLQRAKPAIDSILRRHLGQFIAIVAHNVVNRVYLATAMHIPLAQARSVAQDNCGINILRLRGDELKVLTMNSVWHLP